MKKFFLALLLAASAACMAAQVALVTSKFCSENEKALFRGQRTKIKYG